VVAVAVVGVALPTLPAQANTGGSTAATVTAAPAAASTQAAQVAVNTALAQVGKPYAWGGAGPNSFDCSGLTYFSYKAAGITIPRRSIDQSKFGTPVSSANLKPGDLLFYYSPVSHVTMYIGNGQMVHASTAGQPVKVVSVSSMSKWFSGARRVA
jgi:cell wall-associated NlpC family hydrolase